MKRRRATQNGRDFIVAPMVLIVPGVLPGSRGPLLYPASVVSRDPGVWNGMPLLAYHPKERNKSGRDPSVLTAQGIGLVLNARYEMGALRADGWFDVQSVKRIVPNLLPILEGDGLIELSTGLFTELDGNVVVRMVPDHVAILPDKVGACSIKDGCGVLLNTEIAW